jgi:hypothetical protein
MVPFITNGHYHYDNVPRIILGHSETSEFHQCPWPPRRHPPVTCDGHGAMVQSPSGEYVLNILLIMVNMNGYYMVNDGE